jgi:hypothetical protein
MGFLLFEFILGILAATKLSYLVLTTLIILHAIAFFVGYVLEGCEALAIAFAAATFFLGLIAGGIWFVNWAALWESVAPYLLR